MKRPRVTLCLQSTSRVQTSPKKDKTVSKDSFQNFALNTIDAWDDGDDDLLAMNPQVIQSTALQVYPSLLLRF